MRKFELVVVMCEEDISLGIFMKMGLMNIEGKYGKGRLCVKGVVVRGGPP